MVSRKKEVLAAVLILCELEQPESWKLFRHLKSRLVRRAVLSKYRRFQRKKLDSQVLSKDARRRAIAVSAVMPEDSNFDGSWLEGFLNFLIEKGPEILDLILVIIGMFGTEDAMSCWDVDELSDDEVEVVVAVCDSSRFFNSASEFCAILDALSADCEE